MGWRNRKYDRGDTPIHQAEVPVVCIGNLTTGGTGKTPVVCHLARWLRDQGVRVAIISRGYRSDASGVNDEAKELAQHLPDVPHVQDADRVKAANIAVDELECEFILMDDGFQHRRMHRDVDVVVIDATVPFGHGHLLPRGLLREPIAALTRADAVLLTRCDLVTEDELSEIEQTIGQHVAPSVPMLRTHHAAKQLRWYPDRTSEMEELRGKRVVTVCAIGNPEAFEKTVECGGGQVVDRIRMPDHDSFGPDSVQRLQDMVRNRGDKFDLFVCTHKDLVKLQTDRIAGKGIAALEIELTFDTDPAPLYELLAACCDNPASS